jgi:hypothetical protein
VINLKQKLKGVRITNVEHVHDYVQIEFENSFGISIYNKYTVTGGKIGDVVGKRVTGFVQDERSVSLLVNSKLVVRVGLENDDYSGPEAMQYNDSTGMIVVWN